METDPYEDPALNPGFVRSTKEYLKQANQKDVLKQIQREEQEALKNPDRDNVSSGMSFMEQVQRRKQEDKEKEGRN